MPFAFFEDNPYYVREAAKRGFRVFQTILTAKELKATCEINTTAHLQDRQFDFINKHSGGNT